MVFKSFERGHLELSVIMTLSALASSMVNAQTTTPAAPATVDACVALASNADRLACYDSLFKAPTVIAPQVQVAEPIIAVAAPSVENKNEKAEPTTLRDKVVQKVSDLHILGAAPKFDPNFPCWTAVGSCRKKVNWGCGIFVLINLFICCPHFGPVIRMNFLVAPIQTILLKINKT